MGDPTSPPSRPTPARPDTPAIPARWGFLKGFLTGAAIEIPALAATVWVLGRAGFGDPDADFMRIVRLTTVFAGLAALLTAGGIGRLAAYASVDGGRRRAAFVAARAHAIASAGLVLIATVPYGNLPTDPWGWLPIPAAGLVAGAVCGALIGVVCGGAAPVGLSDVWSIAKKPSEAIRQLLSPDDIVKLGSALKARTTNLFEGIFDPAPLPPKPPPPEPKPDESAPRDTPSDR